VYFQNLKCLPAWVASGEVGTGGGRASGDGTEMWQKRKKTIEHVASIEGIFKLKLFFFYGSNKKKTTL